MPLLDDPHCIFAVIVLGALVPLNGCADPNVTKRDNEAVPVTVTEVKSKSVPLIVRAIGTVNAKEAVAVRAQVGGVLTAIHFVEGTEVKANDLLFTLDARPFRVALHAAQAGLARNRALLAKAEEDSRRYARLVKSGFVTQEQADQTRTNAASLAAAVQADTAAVEAARLQLDYCTIRAPIHGRVGQTAVDVGNLIKANDAQPLVMLLQTDPIEVIFSIPERVLPALRAVFGGQPLVAIATPPGESAASLGGAVVFVDNAVDPGTGTLLLKAEFANDEGRLWPGQFVEVALTLRVDTDAIVVPTEAVQNGREGSFVFAVKSDETVDLRPIVVAREAGDESVIASGLTKGEIVVRDGQLRLFPGAKVLRKDVTETTAP
ncbi:MAG: hypothetical protein A2289_10245 [Deltaproteobacteria bacterium RIFOXYA12_FULL_58_15]|nr:MAG: hypothetical protein A2289_10245 [Deltaproteobacteria bacterium RIFOXYA12_FULL_58_15]OGR08964.1 MAG: hypothetical protein A2341_26855 [Deltaproteobacteria bacterium RIFOXYB12_FULL_58_9]